MARISGLYHVQLAAPAAAGHEVRRDDPLRLPDGAEFAHLYVTDPVGNRLEFLQPLG